jgi:hypothetical protein
VLSVCYCFYSNVALAETNQYGVDCDATPWMSSCGEGAAPSGDGVTEYTISDDGYAKVDLPFNFTLYGTTFTGHSWFHSNGVISFLGTSSPNAGHMCCSGGDLSNPGYWVNNGNAGAPMISHMIAALWTDLRDYNIDVDGDGIDDTGFYTDEVDTDNDGNIDTMRYLWRNISEYGRSNNLNTFGVEITSSNTIEMHYFDVNITNHAVTIGVTGDMTDSETQDPEYYQFVYEAYNSTTGFDLDSVQNITGATQNGIDTILTFNLGAACNVNPLISPTCDGYEEAYAELIYNQSCAADPLYDIGCAGYETAYYNSQCNANALYDSGCPGYETAYYEQQCSLDPLYDTGCDGYETAYYNSQCSLDPLYDSGCPGYSTAYYNQQCSLDALYDTGCPGYETAYYNQQCSIDALYDVGCDGYETAYIESQCELDALYSPTCSGYAAAMAELETQNTTSSETVSDDLFVEEASATGDAVVDDVLQAEETVSVAPTGGFSVLDVSPFEDEFDTVEIETTIQEQEIETAEVIEGPVVDEAEELIVAELDEPVEEINENETTTEDEPSGDVDEQVDTSGNEEGSEQGNDGDDGETSSDTEGNAESDEQVRPTPEQKREARKKKIRAIAKAKAMQLAQRLADAASFEAQQQAQISILAFINYNPGFLDYANMGLSELDFYRQEQMPDGEIDKNSRGLRNGLAQQLLHEEMVDMQYERMNK